MKNGPFLCIVMYVNPLWSNSNLFSPDFWRKAIHGSEGESTDCKNSTGSEGESTDCKNSTDVPGDQDESDEVEPDHTASAAKQSKSPSSAKQSKSPSYRSILL